MSAVSNNVMPRSIALWITLREVSRSVRWPKLLQPRPTAETRRPEPPRLRICMEWSCSGEGDGRGCTLARDGSGRKVRSGQACPAGPAMARDEDAAIVVAKKMRPRSDAATDGDRWGA